VFWLVEPRRFELLTSCLQIGLITRDNDPDLGERQSASNREYPLLTALNGPLMARRSVSSAYGGHHCQARFQQRSNRSCTRHGTSRSDEILGHGIRYSMSIGLKCHLHRVEPEDPPANASTDLQLLISEICNKFERATERGNITVQDLTS
jgi:hypothetical protein